MIITAAGISSIKQSEQCRLHTYLDSVGIPTIGWGCTEYASGEKVAIGDVMTQQQADDQFAYDLDKFSKLLTPLLKVILTDNQFSALMSLVYNIGIGNFKCSHLLQCINKNPHDPAIKALWYQWDHAGGKEVEGLEKRREREYNMYIS